MNQFQSITLQPPAAGQRSRAGSNLSVASNRYIEQVREVRSRSQSNAGQAALQNAVASVPGANKGDKFVLTQHPDAVTVATPSAVAASKSAQHQQSAAAAVTAADDKFKTPAPKKTKA